MRLYKIPSIWKAAATLLVLAALAAYLLYIRLPHFSTQTEAEALRIIEPDPEATPEDTIRLDAKTISRIASPNEDPQLLLDRIRELSIISNSTPDFNEDTLQGYIKELQRSGVIDQYIRDSPVDFAEWIASLPYSQHRIDLRDDFLKNWFESDFSSTLTWVQRLPASDFQDGALLALVPQWAKYDPDNLTDYALSLPESHSSLLLSITGRWAREAPVATAEWAALLPLGERRDKILPSVIAAWAKQDAAASIEFLSNLPDDRSTRDAYISSISALSMQEPDLAAKLAISIENEKLRQYALETVIIRWAKTKPLDSLDWIKSNATGDDFDKAAVAGVAAIVSTDPEIATIWATVINDESTRIKQLQRSLKEWIKSAPDEANKWTIESGIVFD